MGAIRNGKMHGVCVMRRVCARVLGCVHICMLVRACMSQYGNVRVCERKCEQARGKATGGRDGKERKNVLVHG